MMRIVLPAFALLSFASTAASAGPYVARTALNITATTSQVTLAASRTPRHAKGPAQALKGNGAPVKDTCPADDKKCIKQLTASCDKAGGGLSTQPDGGVDCYVVGIHDQP